MSEVPLYLIYQESVNPVTCACNALLGAPVVFIALLVLWCFSLNPHRRSPYPNSQLESRDKLRVSYVA